MLRGKSMGGRAFSAPRLRHNFFAHLGLWWRALLGAGLFEVRSIYGRLNQGALFGDGLEVLSRRCGRRVFAFARWPRLSVSGLSVSRAVWLLAPCLLVRIPLMFGMTVPTPTTPTSTAALLARAFGGSVTRLALLHGSQRLLRILPRGAI